MPAASSPSFSQAWFGNDYKQKILISQGEFILYNMGSSQPVKLGDSFGEIKDALIKLDAINNFPDFQ